MLNQNRKNQKVIIRLKKLKINKKDIKINNVVIFVKINRSLINKIKQMILFRF